MTAEQLSERTEIGLPCVRKNDHMHTCTLRYQDRHKYDEWPISFTNLARGSRCWCILQVAYRYNLNPASNEKAIMKTTASKINEHTFCQLYHNVYHRDPFKYIGVEIAKILRQGYRRRAFPFALGAGIHVHTRHASSTFVFWTLLMQTHRIAIVIHTC